MSRCGSVNIIFDYDCYSYGDYNCFYSNNKTNKCLQGERATGYGVALLTALFAKHTCDPLLQTVSKYVECS